MSVLRRYQKSRQRTKKLTGRVFADRLSHRRLRIEALEQRQLLSTVAWTGGGNDSNWDNPQNWNTQAVPAAGNDVVIDTGSSAATVTINTGDAESVNSLTTGGNDTLSITGGSLTVAANSTLGGSLAMTGGSLTASGEGITLTVNGSTTVSNANLSAEAGATLSLPNLVSYSSVTEGNGGIIEIASNTLEATGTGSTLAMDNLTALTEGNSDDTLTVEAQAGGTVTLPALAEIDTGTVDLVSDGTGSVLEISALTSVSAGGGSGVSGLQHHQGFGRRRAISGCRLGQDGLVMFKSYLGVESHGESARY